MPDDASKKNRRGTAPKTQWSIADAKARFSEVVEKSKTKAQTLTKNGRPVAVVVGIEEWNQKNERKGTLLEFLQSAPEGFADLDLRRSRERAHDVKL